MLTRCVVAAHRTHRPSRLLVNDRHELTQSPVLLHYRQRRRLLLLSLFLRLCPKERAALNEYLDFCRGRLLLYNGRLTYLLNFLLRLGGNVYLDIHLQPAGHEVIEGVKVPLVLCPLLWFVSHRAYRYGASLLAGVPLSPQLGPRLRGCLLDDSDEIGDLEVLVEAHVVLGE